MIGGNKKRETIYFISDVLAHNTILSILLGLYSAIFIHNVSIYSLSHNTILSIMLVLICLILIHYVRSDFQG